MSCWTLMVLYYQLAGTGFMEKQYRRAECIFTFQRGRRLEAMNRIRDPKKGFGDENASFDSMARHTFTDNDPAYEITEGKT